VDPERIVLLTHQGRTFVFRVDYEPPGAFWNVESEGRAYRSPLLVSGKEEPGFFRSLAHVAVLNGV